MFRPAYSLITLAVFNLFACKEADEPVTSPPLTVPACRAGCEQRAIDCREACATALCRTDCENAQTECSDACGPLDAGADSGPSDDDSDAGELPRVSPNQQSDGFATGNVVRGDSGVGAEPTDSERREAAGSGGGPSGPAAGSGGAGAAPAAGTGGTGPTAGVGPGPTAGFGPEAGVPAPNPPVAGFGPEGGAFAR
jgi:hypothetical protein